MMVARASSAAAAAAAAVPRGPGSAFFPNLALVVGEGSAGTGAGAAFWIGLALQLSTCVGGFWGFRKERLDRP